MTSLPFVIQQVAVCRFIPRINSPPSFVALVPEVAVGLHVIFYPFAEDMRKLPCEKDMPRASEVSDVIVAGLVTS